MCRKDFDSRRRSVQLRNHSTHMLYFVSSVCDQIGDNPREQESP
jgi:hypothetical protein